MGNLVENTDSALLSDEEVYKLKGGDTNFLVKSTLGVGAVVLFLLGTKRINELRRFEVRGKHKMFKIKASTFLLSNLVFLSTATLYQKLYNEFFGVSRRLNLHKSALIHRFISNYSYMSTNRKKPIIH